jgi:segregation and condensation protein A
VIHRVQLEVFDGPIELLLYFIREQELDITEIPIARITDQYLSYTQAAANLNLENAAEFLLMAVVLLRMKMRSLLPRPQSENLDTGSVVNMDDIVAEFRRYQQAAQLLSGREDERRNLFPRAGASRVEIETSGDVLLLTNAFRAVVARLTPRDDFVVERVQLRIEERLESLRTALAERRAVDFIEYLAHLNSISEIIITFLAALELARLGELRVSQDEATGAIYIFGRRVPAMTPGQLANPNGVEGRHQSQ